MAEEHVPKVVNTHWFESADKLPPNTTYIGRPSAYGNAYSSKTGKHTREECIALHRIDLYRSLTDDPAKLAQLRTDLAGQDLACWCKNPKRVVGCHGDTLLHILSPRLVDRTYTKSVISYLMEDVRLALTTLRERIFKEIANDDFLSLYAYDEEVRLEINEAVRLSKVREAPNSAVEFLLAQLAVDLELAIQETDPVMMKFRIDHACWVATYFHSRRTDRYQEPVAPNLPETRTPRKKKS